MKEAEDSKADYKQAMKVHAEAFEVITALQQSRTPWMCLTEQARAAVRNQQSMHCPHLQRYFSSPLHMHQARTEEFGFLPAANSTASLYAANSGPRVDSVWNEFNNAIVKVLPNLLPQANFHHIRESAVAQLQSALIAEGAIPPHTEVALYGSSNNSFGSDGADMDMTLLFPPHIHVSAEDKPAVIERLGVVLTKIGMTNVTTRATARIPIVQFTDPFNGNTSCYHLYEILFPFF